MSKRDIRELPIADVLIGQFSYRKYIPEGYLDELGEAIRAEGILQNGMVRPLPKDHISGKKWELIFGECRTRACERIGRLTMPYEVRKLTDSQAAAIALAENLQREDPDDWSTALGLKKLIEVSEEEGNPLSERALAARIKKSTSFVRNHLGLFNLHPDLQAVAQRHTAVKSSLFEIQRVANTDHLEELIELVDQGASYKTVQAAVEGVQAELEWKRESQQAPDAETRQRQSAAKNGGGQMSRGRMVADFNQLEANGEYLKALEQAERHLMAATSWHDWIKSKGVREQASKRIEGIETLLARLKNGF